MNKYIKDLVTILNETLYNGLFDNDELFSGEFDDNITSHKRAILKDDDFLKNILCVSTDYLYIYNNAEDEGLPPVLIEDNLTYVAPFRTYSSLLLGPRKRKLYPLSYFYYYILELTSTDPISYTLYVNLISKKYFIINEALYKLIEMLPINEIIIKDRNSLSFDKILTMNINFENAMIFADKTTKKFSTSFINNFPDKIPSGSLNGKPSSLYKKSFKSNEDFITLVTKLVNNNYTVKDEAGVIYNKENINEATQELLSGEFQRKQNDIENKKIEFIKNEFGSVYIDKFLKLKDYFDNNNIKFYLKKINTLRTNKISIKTTLPELFKDNHINFTLNPNRIPEDELTYIERITLYKIFNIYQSEMLGSYKSTETLDDCIHGYETGYFSYYQSDIRYLDMNDLPVIFRTPLVELYNLYYCIGKACCLMNNCNSSFYNEELNDFLRKDMVFNPETFNYNYLTEQLKFIIDKQCKKFKIK